MDTEYQLDAAVVGGGIVGMAVCIALLRQGRRVHLFESNGSPVEASIRNFGLIWPSGQTEGFWRDTALHSRSLWQEMAELAGFHFHANGSLHLAYEDAGASVLEEFVGQAGQDMHCELVSADSLRAYSAVPHMERLRLAMYCREDATVHPVEACYKIQRWLEGQASLETHYHEPVLYVEGRSLITAKGRYEAGQVYVCNGVQIRNMFPDLYSDAGIRLCKLQMMRTYPMPDGWKLGPTICGDLTLLHYASFKTCPSLPALRDRLRELWPVQEQYGIHILLTQHNTGELTIGDSHEYGDDITPFDRAEINEAILDYLRHLTVLDRVEIQTTWHGVYARSADGLPVVQEISPGVVLIGAVGGAGMTLSMGLCDRVVRGEWPVQELGASRFSSLQA